MGISIAVRRFAVVLAALGLICLAGAGAADATSSADPVKFRAEGVATIIGVEGDILVADLEGEASPGGEFTGTLTEKLIGFGAIGTVTFDFDGGSLTISFADTVPPGSVIKGGWQVVGGTGDFAGVKSGGGKITGAFTDEITADFTVTGTVVFDE